MSNPTELPDLDRQLFEADAAKRAVDLERSTMFPDRYKYQYAAFLWDFWQSARRAQPEGEAPQAEPVLWQVLKRRDEGGEIWADISQKDFDRFRADQPDVEVRALSVRPPAAQHAESGALAGEYCDHPAFLKIMDDILTPQGMAKFNADEDVNLHREFAGAIFMAGLAAQSQGAPAPILYARQFDLDTIGSHGVLCFGDADHIGAAGSWSVPLYLAAQQAAAPGALPDLLPPLGIRNDRDMLNYLITAFDNEIANCERCGHAEPTKNMDSASFLRDYLAAAPSAPGTPEAPQTAAARDVLAERKRQVEAEGRTPERDDKYINCELARAAATYATCSHIEQLKIVGEIAWPWHPEWFKRSGYRRDLEKAGALVLAEIERLDRAAQLNGGQGEGAANG